jgi:hypothetical protein
MDKIYQIPTEEDRGFLLKHKQVFKGAGCDGHFMTLKALRKAVLARKADHWNVVDIDLETGQPSLICPWCATGLEHPAGLAESK